MTVLRVIAPGGLARIQDLGRPGYDALGVPRAGAMDSFARRGLHTRVGGPVDVSALAEPPRKLRRSMAAGKARRRGLPSAMPRSKCRRCWVSKWSRKILSTTRTRAEWQCRCGRSMIVRT